MICKFLDIAEVFHKFVQFCTNFLRYLKCMYVCSKYYGRIPTKNNLPLFSPQSIDGRNSTPVPRQ